jgi:hypothetical protein
MTENNTTEEEKEKQFGDCKLSFNKGISKNGETCYLKISMNDDLKSFLEKSIIDETTEFLIYERISNGINKQKKIIRYKVKSVIYNAILNSDKDFLFIKEFIDKKKITLNFSNMDRVTELMSEILSSIRQLLRIVSELEITQDITFKINTD